MIVLAVRSIPSLGVIRWKYPMISNTLRRLTDPGKNLSTKSNVRTAHLNFCEETITEMPISRRFFLKSGTLTAIAAAFALKAQTLTFAETGTSQGLQIPLTAQQQSTYMFTRSTFVPYIGGIFQTPDARGRLISLTLLSATAYKSATTTSIPKGTPIETDSFSLMFKAARALPEFTSIFKVSHPSLGEFDLFLSLHSQARKEPIYEAVFNHI